MLRSLAIMATLGGLTLVALAGSACPQASAAPPDSHSLAERINLHLELHWKARGIQPAAPASDATFLRRAYLDLIGRIPTVAEVRDYLDDEDPAKRTQMIRRLIGSAAHARHMASFWRRNWLPQTDTPQFSALRSQAEDWIVARLNSATPYDEMVSALLSAESANTVSSPNQLAGPSALLLASEFKPANLAANSARAFLGINLDCAECHDHPFARWSRDQFWQTAAFFSKPSPVLDGQPRLEIEIPETGRTVSAALLSDDPLIFPEQIDADTGRQLLAAWIVRGENPYFAKNAVNRLWAALYGAGIVEPLDDLSGANPPAIPGLLDELAQSFVQSDYNLAYLTRAIVLSRGYGLEAAGDSQTSSVRTFAQVPFRGLTGEQLYDSLRTAAGLSPERQDLDPIRAQERRQRFVAQFHTERPLTAQRSVTQALTLMNGDLSRQLTDRSSSPFLAAVAESPLLDRSSRIETLYLAALSRRPEADELRQHNAYLAEQMSTTSEPAVLADLFWALINSAEFNTNH